MTTNTFLLAITHNDTKLKKSIKLQADLQLRDNIIQTMCNIMWTFKFDVQELIWSPKAQPLGIIQAH